MSSAFEQIQAGLTDAINHAKGNSSQVIEHKQNAINVKEIRAKTGLSQQRFCTSLGVSITTLRHWEKGFSTPRGAAKVLLKIVEKNPKMIMDAINS
jgi:putative transcriptional regulator